jgi:hypothetical protein
MINLNGKTVRINTGTPLFGQDSAENTLIIEAPWQDIAGKGWMDSAAQGNMAAFNYMTRVRANDLPYDNDVVYGKTPNGLGHLIHVSEIV